jgi:hypothetical protein
MAFVKGVKEKMEFDNTLPCADKLAFETKTQAEGSAVAIKWQRGTDLKANICKHCKLWHLASLAN